MWLAVISALSLLIGLMRPWSSTHWGRTHSGYCRDSIEAIKRPVGERDLLIELSDAAMDQLVVLGYDPVCSTPPKARDPAVVGKPTGAQITGRQFLAGQSNSGRCSGRRVHFHLIRSPCSCRARLAHCRASMFMAPLTLGNFSGHPTNKMDIKHER